MALKNHALDDGILQAAKAEFLEKGYEAASLRKIAAQAGVTIGAIYTRYPTKDQLFCALVQPLLDQIGEAFSSLKGSYYQEQQDLQPELMAKSLALVSQTILHLLFDDYVRAVLLLCRSTGSSLASFFDQLVERKIQETLIFFQGAGVAHPSEDLLRLLVSSQCHMDVQIIRGGYDLEQAKTLMEAAMVYHTGGWMALLQ